MALSYHELGIVAQLRGRLDEAEGWYKKSLAIYRRWATSRTWPQTTTSLAGWRSIAAISTRPRAGKEIPRHHEALGNQPGIAITYH